MQELPYTLGTWRTLTTYKCRYCPFDSTEEAVTQAHYQERHAPRPRDPQPLQPAGIAIADKSGREVWPGGGEPAQPEALEIVEVTEDALLDLLEKPRRGQKRREV